MLHDPDKQPGARPNARQSAAITTISENGWLAVTPPGFRDWALDHLQWRAYAAGEGITHAGHEDGALYCVGDGQIHFVAGLGMDDIGTGYIGLPGIWWGHAPLLGGERVGSTVASTDMLCGALPQSALRARLASHPQDWEQMARAMAGLFRHSAGAHADLLISDSRRRVAATILRLAGWRHRMHRLTPPAAIVCTQEQVAGAVALSRNTTGKILRDLQADGLIDARYGSLAVLAPARLRALAEGG
jgi:CRP-like cAMP-binding protein